MDRELKLILELIVVVVVMETVLLTITFRRLVDEWRKLVQIKRLILIRGANSVPVVQVVEELEKDGWEVRG